MKLPATHAEFHSLSKQALHELADGLLLCESNVLDYCVKFVLAETKGVWHGRARAMMSRRLKHFQLGRTHRAELLSSILGRLQSGEFSEQFKDQLRLALHLDSEQTLKICKLAASSSKPYVRRYAKWALTLPRGENAV